MQKKTHRVRFNGLVLLAKVPDLDSEVVPGDHQVSAVAELHVADTRDDLAEETAVRRIFSLFKHYKTMYSFIIPK